MAKIVSLDERYATTRLCHKLIPEEYLNGEGKVDPQRKFAIDIPEYGIKASRVPAKADKKFDTLLFQPEGEGRRGEGGLRTLGHFKHSYKKVDGQWYIVDRDDNPIEPIDHMEAGSIFDIRHSAFESLPLVTVITVVYNGEMYLEETIKSILGLDYSNIEYIVVDGASTDSTTKIVKKYEKYIDYWVSEKDDGIYAAMNKGVDLASGVWINFINAGDRFFYLEPHDLLKNNHSFSNYYYDKERRKIKRDPLTKSFLTRNMVCHQSIIYKKSEIIKYNQNEKIISDFAQLLQILGEIGRGESGSSIMYFDNPGISSLEDKSLYSRFDHLKRRNRYLCKTLGSFYCILAYFHSVRSVTKALIRRIFDGGGS